MHVFQYHFKQTFKKCKSSMGRETVPVSLLLLWSAFFSKSFYKAHEGPNFVANKIEYSTYSVSGKHFIDSLLSQGNRACQINIDFSITESEFFDKYEKVSTSNLPEKRVSWDHSVLLTNDSLPSSGQSEFRNRTVSGFSHQRSNVGEEYEQLIVKICYLMAAFLPDRLHYRSLQRQQILRLEN